MIPKHFRPAGQITDRLLADPELTLDGWWPDRDASLRTRCRPAAVGYRVGRRRRQRSKRAWAFQTIIVAILGITTPYLVVAGNQGNGHVLVGDEGVQRFCFVEKPAPGIDRCHGWMPPEWQR